MRDKITVPTCSVAGCDKPRKPTKGGSYAMCSMHVARKWRGTDLLTPPLGERDTVLARFLKHTRIYEGCWEWDNPRHNGYGRMILRGGGQILAHRLAYQLFRGPLDPALTIDHLCGNTACVRPDHLEQVPHSVNVARGLGPSAVNGRKTTCKRGHPLPPHIPYRRRECLACRM